jgi:uncharacterized protein (DUF2147 family)
VRIAEALLLATLIAPCHAGATAQTDVLGLWQTEDKRGVIRFGPCGATLCGVIVGTDPGKNGAVLRDIQGRPQCHLSIVNDLRPGQDSRLHGTVTDPEDGRVYGAEVWVPADGVLRLRGYIGLPILGATQLWPRYHGSIGADCQFHRE